MERVLIMGGSYFIGRHVIKALKGAYELYVLNRGNHPLDDSEVTELRSDRNDEATMKAVLKGHEFDHVVDISCFNRRQAEILMDAIDTETLKTYVFVSTSAVYNIQRETPPFEEGARKGGASPFSKYAKDKIETERYLNSILEAVQLVILRPPYVYGEDNYLLRERLFFHLIEEEQPIFVPRSDNRIQFVYVRDLAEDIRSAVRGEVPAGAYNVGDPDAVTFTAFIHRCAFQVGKAPIIRYVESDTLKIPLMHYFPFFDYDNILSVEKLHSHARHVTAMRTALRRAYEDYRTIKPLALPKRMKEARERLLSMKLIKNPIRGWGIMVL